jgi:ribosome recycling factor
MLKEILKHADESMNNAIEHLQHELAGIRTGKANPALLDSIRVDYYGQKVPLNQVASVAAPDPQLITIQPWDKGVIGDIEKAIQASELGLNPQNDGTVIRLPIPQLTEERRKELVKVVKRVGEDAKVALRNIRRHANDEVKKLEKEHEIGEDEMHTNQEEIQKLTDKYVENIDGIISAKEKEILEI